MFCSKRKQLIFLKSELKKVQAKAALLNEVFADRKTDTEYLMNMYNCLNDLARIETEVTWLERVANEQSLLGWWLLPVTVGCLIIALLPLLISVWSK